MCSSEKDPESRKLYTIVKHGFTFAIRFSHSKNENMMREMEKMLENLKVEFNKKMATDSFMSYFVKETAPVPVSVSEEGRMSIGSYDDITMESNPSPLAVEDFCDNRSIFIESPGQEIIPIISFDREPEEVANKSEICDNYPVEVVIENKYSNEEEDIDEQVCVDTIVDFEPSKDVNAVVTSTENMNIEDHEIWDDVHDESFNTPKIHISRMGSPERPLNVIDEEEITDHTGETSNEDNDKHNIEVASKDELIVEQCILEFINDYPDQAGDVRNAEVSSDAYIEIITEEEVNNNLNLSTNGSTDNHKFDLIDDLLPNGSIEPADSEECSQKANDSDSKISVRSKPESETQDVVDFASQPHTPNEIVTISPKVTEQATPNDNVPSSPKTTKQTDQPATPEFFKKQCLQRMLWSEMPEVIESGILSTLPKKRIQLQEAMFEIITSEASYYQSLMILTTYFFDSPLFKMPGEMEGILSTIDQHHIFSNILLVTQTSLKLCNDLDQRWLEQKPQLKQICDILLTHVNGADFMNYVTYLRNQEYQNKALKRLAENETFKQQLQKLENSAVCGKLSLDSYLMLPMQRLTRLKLLVDTLLKVMYSDELKDFVEQDEINTAELTSLHLKMLLETSDTQKGLMDQKSMLMLLLNRMDFPPNVRRITVSDKTLIKEDEVRVHQQTPIKYVRKFSKKRQPTISLILFNDLLIVAKTKNMRLLVIDFCSRENIEVSETRYKSIVSSADVSNSVSVDFEDDAEDKRKTSISSLSRSKSSVPPDEFKRFSSNLTNSFKSLSLVNRMDEQEIINNSFSLKFTKSETDIFNFPIALLAKDKVDRDEWMALLKNSSATDGKLHKTTSLKHSAITKENFGLSKTQSCFTKRKDEIIDQILAQREVAQDCSDDFLTIKFNYRINFDQ